MRSEHVSVVIRRPPAEVSAFAGDPANLPRWAAGLASGELRREGEWLVVDSPVGAVRVRFTAMNSYGVLDHDVVLPDGEVVHNPLRVVPHPDGSEVIFTVRQRGMTPAQLERDVAAVRADLERLRDLMEAVPGPEVEGGPLTAPDVDGFAWLRVEPREQPDAVVEVRGALADLELDNLHAAAFGDAPAGVPWRERLEQHSLFWVTARLDGELVGFVNVVGDGGAHAVLLDTCVDPAHQGLGIGVALVRATADEARARGCRWLHADYAPEHADFYERACGLRPTSAGVRDLS